RERTDADRGREDAEPARTGIEDELGGERHDDDEVVPEAPDDADDDEDEHDEGRPHRIAKAFANLVNDVGRARLPLQAVELRRPHHGIGGQHTDEAGSVDEEYPADTDSRDRHATKRGAKD